MGAISSTRDLRAALRRQAWLILLLSVLGMAAALQFARTRPLAFEAVAMVQIEPPQVAGAAGAVGSMAAGGLTANGQLDLIQQRLLARDALAALADRLGLFPDAGSDTARAAALREAVTITKLVDPAQAWRPDVQPSGLLIAVLLGDPESAAAAANALGDSVVAEARGRAAAVAEATLGFHRAEEARVRGALEAVEAGIAELRAANVASLPEALSSQRERVTSLTEDRISAEQRILEFESGAARLRPEELERQRALLDEGRDVILQALAETQAALDAAPDVERQLGALSRERAALEAELSVVIADRRDAETVLQLQDSQQASRFTVLERALPPESPVSASKRKLAMAGAVAAVLGALALGLARELTEPAIRTAAQMKRTLGIEPLVVIPRLRRGGGRRGGRGRLAGGGALGLLAILSGLAALVAGAAFLAQGGWRGLLDALPRPATPGG